MHREIFGPFSLIIECDDQTSFEEVASSLEGQLTLTFMGTEPELAGHRRLIDIAREKAGRIIFNGVHTGVEVSPAMNHGGPYHATTDTIFTYLSYGAIRRFHILLAFDVCLVQLLYE